METVVLKARQYKPGMLCKIKNQDLERDEGAVNEQR